MKDILSFLYLNKEWLFSGLGIISLTVFVKFFVSNKNEPIDPKFHVTGSNHTIINGNSNEISNTKAEICKNELTQVDLYVHTENNVEDDSNELLDTELSFKQNTDGFSKVNVKLLNEMSSEVFISQIDYRIRNYKEINVLRFEYEMEMLDDTIVLLAKNIGWGEIDNCKFDVKLSINSYSSSGVVVKRTVFYNYKVNKINSGKEHKIASISSNMISKEIAIISDEHNIDVEFANIEVSVACDDDCYAKLGYYKKIFTKYSIQYKNGTMLKSNSSIRYCRSAPDSIYSTLIDVNSSCISYKLSRVIDKNCTDEFEIYLGANRACTFECEIALHYNGNKILYLNPLFLEVTRKNDSRTINKYYDGCTIGLNDRKIVSRFRSRTIK